MRRFPFLAGAIPALLIAACGTTSPTSSTPASTCANPKAAHHAYVVVQHLAGASKQACVGFAGATIDGITLLKQSGFESQTATTSFGPAVCQVDNEPKQFATCFPKDQPYWSLWIETAGKWTLADKGFDQEQFGAGDAMGWRYTPSTDQNPSPPPLAKAS